MCPGAPVAESPGPRGLVGQKEAQGQGVRAGRKPRGRHSGGRGAGRAARRAHRVRARLASTTGAGPRARPGVTGPAADGSTQSVASALNRAAGGRPIPGNRVELLIDGRDTYAAMLDLIAHASRWIHFENYIIRSDSEGWR